MSVDLLNTTSLLRKPSESSDTVYSELTLVTHQGKCIFTIHKEPLKTASRSIEILRMKLNTAYTNVKHAFWI